MSPSIVALVLGLAVGVALWAYTLLLPSLGPDVVFTSATLQSGPWGIAALRPEALFCLTGLDPLVHAIVVSIGANVLMFLVVSVLTEATTLEFACNVPGHYGAGMAGTFEFAD